MDLVKKEDPEKAVRTPFYQTESTGGFVGISLNRIFSIKLWNTKEQIIMS